MHHTKVVENDGICCCITCVWYWQGVLKDVVPFCSRSSLGGTEAGVKVALNFPSTSGRSEG